jgi:hypothetical protein
LAEDDSELTLTTTRDAEPPTGVDPVDLRYEMGSPSRVDHEEGALRRGQDVAGGVADIAVGERDPPAGLGDPAVNRQRSDIRPHRGQVFTLISIEVYRDLRTHFRTMRSWR